MPNDRPDFLPDDDSAEGRGDDRVAFQVAQFIRQLAADPGRDFGVLEQDRALEKLPAMQAGAKDEMPVEQRAGLAEKRQQIFTHATSLRS